MVTNRATSQKELNEIVDYWTSLPRGSGYYAEKSLIRFLGIFTPDQIKGAMSIAMSAAREAYFRYLCGILHNWRRELEAGRTPLYSKVHG